MPLGTLHREPVIESDNSLGPQKEQFELIFTLEHGLGSQRVAGPLGWLSQRPTQ